MRFARVTVAYQLLQHVHVSTSTLSLPKHWRVVMTQTSFQPAYVNKVHLHGPTHNKHFAAHLAEQWIRRLEDVRIVHMSHVDVRAEE